jgi:hypothetical protein
LVFQLKDAVGWQEIRRREESFIQRAIKRWENNPNIEILGNHDAWRLSIVSFLVKYDKGYLHHNFVVALLNDLFGIQARGGCSCAGPYGHRLLNIAPGRAEEYERAVHMGCEALKPGWVRMNFNYFVSEEIFNYLLDAVDLIATKGWMLLPDYRFDPEQSLWRHKGRIAKPGMRLTDVSYTSGRMEYRARHATEPAYALQGYIDEAKAIINERSLVDREEAPKSYAFDNELHRLRWFPLPNEINTALAEETSVTA